MKNSRSVNSELTDDEISAVTNTITSIVGEVKYDIKIADADGEQVIIWTATLTANIDTDGLQEYINRDWREKNMIVDQNKSLQETFRLNDEQLAELKEKYKNAKTQSEKDLLAEQLKIIDRDFLAAQKLEEAKNTNWSDKKRKIQLCNEAIELKPDYADAYSERGECYDGLDNEKALQDHNKAIELEPKAVHYINRAFFYEVHLKNYDLALSATCSMLKRRCA